MRQKTIRFNQENSINRAPWKSLGCVLQQQHERRRSTFSAKPGRGDVQVRDDRAIEGKNGHGRRHKLFAELAAADAMACLANGLQFRGEL